MRPVPASLRCPAAHGHDQLREHIERILHDARRLDVTGPHRLQDHELFQRIIAERGDEDTTTQRVERVTGATHALQRR